VIALLRRDWPWLTFFLLSGVAALVAALGEERFESVWVMPTRRMDTLFHVGWIVGAALGVFAACYDDLLGTREYARHRPVPVARLHASRMLGCAAVLGGWLLLAPAVQWALEWVFGDYARLGRIAPLVDVWANLLPAGSACAVGWFAATLPCAPLLRLLFGGAVGFLLFALADLTTANDGAVLPAFVAVHAAGALLLALASLANAGHRADADRPWSPRVRSVGGVVVALGLGGAGSLLVAAIADENMSGLALAAPRVVRMDGEYRLAIRERDDRSSWWTPVDAEHVATAPGVRRSAVEREVWNRLDVGRSRQPGFDAPQLRPREDSTGTVQLHGGLVYAIDYARPPSLTVVGKGTGKTPFAPDTRLIAVGAFRDSVHWIAEPGATEVWRLDESAQQTVRVPLPEGDRVVGVRSVQLPDERRQVVAGDLTYVLARANAKIVIGERAAYEVRRDSIAPAPDWVQEQAQERGGRVEMLDGDPLRPRIRVLDPNGEPVFEHAYAPRTAVERWYATLLWCTSAVRPPALQLASYLGGGGSRRISPLLDPLLAGGRRAVLLVLCCVVAAASGLAAARRLRRLGASARAQRGWLCAGLLLGPLGLLASLLVERRRAYAPAPEPPAGAPAVPRILTPSVSLEAAS
jgi:hypothetical protein